MRKMFKWAAFLMVPAALMTISSCTDLDETLYDQTASQNYYNTKNDVIRAVLRPFEHGFNSIKPRQELQEYPADQLISPTRIDWWDDGGKWQRMHRHKWIVNNTNIQSEFNLCYQGINQANKVIDDLEGLSASKFGFTEAEFNNLKAQNRVLRAWFYLRLLDEFRNVPLTVSFNEPSKNKGQVEPKELFTFIETELKEALPMLNKKLSMGGNGNNQGQWTQAGAAALLVRLYLNAKVYVNEDHFNDCAQYAQDIINGTYGSYAIGAKWDEAFDWDNDKSDEIIFAFPGSKAHTHWHYDGELYAWTVPVNSKDWLNDAKSEVGHNIKWSASPSLKPDGTSYNFELGMPIARFKKYPTDYRLKMYKNLGNSRREGMFVFGKIEYTDANGHTAYLKDHNNQNELCLRDAVGRFGNKQANEWLNTSESRLEDGDDNSGYMFVKYPLYSDTDEGQTEADYAEIRLPEIYYSLAECKLRAGDTAGAADLLNQVRKRNYPSADWANYEYAPAGPVLLDMKEMLAEWGREFFAEGRRRIDLIRFGKFQDAWWDKEADADKHWEIFPFHTDILSTNKMKQNPGYE